MDYRVITARQLYCRLTLYIKTLSLRLPKAGTMLNHAGGHPKNKFIVNHLVFLYSRKQLVSTLLFLQIRKLH